jgi:transcriptional regulator with XRE-family HTH domain
MNEDGWIEYGASMRRNRQLLGLSVRDAATRAGVSKNTILRLESGRPIHRGSQAKLCRAYGCVPIDPADRQPPSREGTHYKLQSKAEQTWYATRLNAEGEAEAHTSPVIQEEGERERLGLNRLVNHFGLPLRVRREGSRFIPFLIELYGPTDTTCDRSGERFILCLQGSIRVVVGDESFVLEEGESASYDSTLPNRLEPVEPATKGRRAPMALQIVLP